MAKPKATAASTLEMQGDDLDNVFRRFDSNGDGKISASEMGGLLRFLGTDASEDKVQRMMTEMDTDCDGFVDLKEFKDFVLGGKEKDDDGQRQQQQLMDAFKTYDLDGNGRISVKELHIVMKKMGMKCSFGDCNKMIRSVDADGDGCVDFQEFKEMMTRDGINNK